MKTIRLLLLLAVASRLSATTITVNGTGDTIAVNGACTLREAVTAANTNVASGDCPAGTPGLDQIHFSIGAGGAQTITILTPLPSIVDPVTIDGTTQPGFAGTPLVRVAATYIGFTSTFAVLQAGAGSTFRGLIVANASFGAAIELRSSFNVVAGNYLHMIDGSTPDSGITNGVWIVGNVPSPAASNVIGGVAAADRNVFGGRGAGVSISGAPLGTASGNTITGNYFGWNAAKTASVSSLVVGIDLANAAQTTITGNSIVACGANGITMSGSEATVVQSNEIGSLNAGVTSNRVGIAIISSTSNTIGASTSGGAGGNVIVNNGDGTPNSGGVLVYSGTNNRISTNSMSFNAFGDTFLGIDLFPFGSTANDSCDADAGANQLQNKPVLTSAVFAGGMVTIDGSLDSEPSASYTIEFFGNPPAAGDQGHQYLGSANVTTDAGCNATFTATFPFVLIPGGSTITATAIATTGLAAFNTSEMSAPAFIVEELDAPTVTKEFDPESVPIGTQTQLTITLTNANPIAITGVAFTDNYPAGLRNAAMPNVTNTCGGTVVALPAGSQISLSGGTIPANGTCSVSVFVVPVTPGTHVNSLPAGAVTSANAPPSDAAATATLTAGAATSDVPLSPTALMLLAMSLAAAGIYGVRQR